MLLSLTLFTAGCSGSLPEVGLPSAATSAPSAASPVAIYSQIASGANSCWFGPRGILDRAYVFHGKTEPEAAGGQAEIAVHERAEDGRRGAKAFEILIGRRAEAAGIAARNLKMPEPIGRRMVAEAHHWANGGTGCELGHGIWQPSPREPAATKATPKSKALAKTKATGAVPTATGSTAATPKPAGPKP